MSVAPLLRPASSLPLPGAPARTDVLPVLSPLDGLFPYGGLARGSVVAVDSPALALAIVARASGQGAWCAVAGLPTLGAAAAAEIGCDLSRFVVVPSPGDQWAAATATLLDGIELVLVVPPKHPRNGEVRRLAARVRERRGVLVSIGSWPEQADLKLRIEASEWDGLSDGRGRLVARRCAISASGRGAAARERRITTWLPLGS
ncbi:MAG TPA: hypothetical protein VHE83_02280 [Mycobacteriales bacterium]|nr:hypothetical protein [Mycobacteriales bacterium]